MNRPLSAIAAISGLYDLIVGVLMLAATAQMARWFGVPPPVPAIQAQLNGLFLLAVGAGYYFPWRQPLGYRWYLWLMGPVLKGSGATLFLIDHFARGSPASFLLFAASDGSLAVVTLWLLLRERSADGGTPGSREARPRE